MFGRKLQIELARKEILYWHDAYLNKTLEYDELKQSSDQKIQRLQARLDELNREAYLAAFKKVRLARIENEGADEHETVE